MTAVTSNVSTITTSHTFMIFCSKMPWVSRSEAACTSAAASPISVSSPVLVTTARHSPAFTTNPLRISRLSFLPGTLRGMDSPVSAEVSTASSSPSTQSQSAGTTIPPLRRNTSPGTMCEEGKVLNAPSRFTDACVFKLARRAFTSPCDLNSSKNPMDALMSKSVKMMVKSSQSSTAPASTAATSIMKGIGPVNCLRIMSRTDATFSGISFVPNSFRRRSASSLVKPSRLASPEPISISPRSSCAAAGISTK
mmetsp:Transcript_47015/g.93082  ORF Transcript_47015/g.93082 Transcript_47015/m.93082 type:complete len:252 (-) Transcript_47015:14-769(-)